MVASGLSFHIDGRGATDHHLSLCTISSSGFLLALPTKNLVSLVLKPESSAGYPMGVDATTLRFSGRDTCQAPGRNGGLQLAEVFAKFPKTGRFQQ